MDGLPMMRGNNSNNNVGQKRKRGEEAGEEGPWWQKMLGFFLGSPLSPSPKQAGGPHRRLISNHEEEPSGGSSSSRNRAEGNGTLPEEEGPLTINVPREGITEEQFRDYVQALRQNVRQGPAPLYRIKTPAGGEGAGGRLRPSPTQVVRSFMGNRAAATPSSSSARAARLHRRVSKTPIGSYTPSTLPSYGGAASPAAASYRNASSAIRTPQPRSSRASLPLSEEVGEEEEVDQPSRKRLRRATPALPRGARRRDTPSIVALPRIGKRQSVNRAEASYAAAAPRRAVSKTTPTTSEYNPSPTSLTAQMILDTLDQLSSPLYKRKSAKDFGATASTRTVRKRPYNFGEVFEEDEYSDTQHEEWSGHADHLDEEKEEQDEEVEEEATKPPPTTSLTRDYGPPRSTSGKRRRTQNAFEDQTAQIMPSSRPSITANGQHKPSIFALSSNARTSVATTKEKEEEEQEDLEEDQEGIEEEEVQEAEEEQQEEEEEEQEAEEEEEVTEDKGSEDQEEKGKTKAVPLGDTQFRTTEKEQENEKQDMRFKSVDEEKKPTSSSSFFKFSETKTAPVDESAAKETKSERNPALESDASTTLKTNTSSFQFSTSQAPSTSLFSFSASSSTPFSAFDMSNKTSANKTEEGQAPKTSPFIPISNTSTETANKPPSGQPSSPKSSVGDVTTKQPEDGATKQSPTTSFKSVFNFSTTAATTTDSSASSDNVLSLSKSPLQTSSETKSSGITSQKEAVPATQPKPNFTFGSLATPSTAAPSVESSASPTSITVGEKAQPQKEEKKVPSLFSTPSLSTTPSLFSFGKSPSASSDAKQTSESTTQTKADGVPASSSLFFGSTPTTLQASKPAEAPKEAEPAQKEKQNGSKEQPQGFTASFFNLGETKGASSSILAPSTSSTKPVFTFGSTQAKETEKKPASTLFSGTLSTSSAATPIPPLSSSKKVFTFGASSEPTQDKKENGTGEFSMVDMDDSSGGGHEQTEFNFADSRPSSSFTFNSSSSATSFTGFANNGIAAFGNGATSSAPLTSSGSIFGGTPSSTTSTPSFSTSTTPFSGFGTTAASPFTANAPATSSTPFTFGASSAAAPLSAAPPFGASSGTPSIFSSGGGGFSAGAFGQTPASVFGANPPAFGGLPAGGGAGGAAPAGGGFTIGAAPKQQQGRRFLKARRNR
ncbi:Pogo transposable element derived with ZNF domain a [Balamuthia mandrillaris]